MAGNSPNKRPNAGVSVLAVAIPLIAAGLVGPLFGLAPRAGRWEWALYTASAASLLIAVIFQVVAKVRELRRARDVETAQELLRRRLRDELLPFASTLAEMPQVPFAERLAYLKPVATQAVIALRELTEDHVPRMRANIYILDADAQAMESLAHSGRGDKPKPFEADTERGDNALEFVAGTTTAYYPDLRRERPSGYDGSMSGYNSFIAVPIWTDNGHYGMVTVDSPTAGSLTPGDVSIAELIAEFMSIPFEIAQDDPVIAEGGSVAESGTDRLSTGRMTDDRRTLEP